MSLFWPRNIRLMAPPLAIALHYGSDATESALEHRFRPLKKQAQAVREAVSKGKDAKDLANSVVKNEKGTVLLYLHSFFTARHAYSCSSPKPRSTSLTQLAHSVAQLLANSR